jgi:DNA-binding transcriptional ArsR family regulator
MNELDRTIHEPARLRILMILSGVDLADFNFLLSALGLTSGNLSSHLDRLEKSGYIEIRKSFEGKTPKTECRLSSAGRDALADYWQTIDEIRSLPAMHEQKG